MPDLVDEHTTQARLHDGPSAELQKPELVISVTVPGVCIRFEMLGQMQTIQDMEALYVAEDQRPAVALKSDHIPFEDAQQAFGCRVRAFLDACVCFERRDDLRFHSAIGQPPQFVTVVAVTLVGLERGASCRAPTSTRALCCSVSTRRTLRMP